MTTREINALLALRGLNVAGLAQDIKVNPDAISQTINYLRPNLKIRTKLAKRLGMSVDELFEPPIGCVTAEERDKKVAAQNKERAA